ncbi:Putative metal-binding motif-containing protein [Myxococcus fulvus]|uniref:Metal-binding motif-containing protein n=1 Tax=Myxococcus fulvus TaxID=33 RepID=A0A511T455_MYXFU|nr:putative metal-binding motif-containing protein [Myxococcus fulvus]GEN08707.1 hypothetical protein MFU01_37440 [Myxococcus fulvus]SEU29817.1 Putative metal-binding motif-containing protein [Myxococcus fulvus]
MKGQTLPFLFFATSCMVPDLKELDTECDRVVDPSRIFEGSPADVILGDGMGCRYANVTVSSAGFTPACMRLVARDQERLEEVWYNLEYWHSRPDAVHVTILPRAGWSPALEIEARIFEESCDGPVVEVQKAELTLGIGKVARARLEFDARDTDGDGFVARETGGTDCNDNDALINRRAIERCNGQDENCDGHIDESFPSLGASCQNQDSVCMGTVQCVSQSSVACVAPGSPTTWYLDEDGDGYGGATNPVLACTHPTNRHVLLGGDCNDGNPYTHPGATEICDEADNDCDGLAENVSRCPGGVAPSWVARTVYHGAVSDWHSASSWTRGGVWIGGGQNRRARLTPGTSDFSIFSEVSCGSTNEIWTGLWADPSTGQAWLASKQGLLGYQTVSDGNCVAVHEVDATVRGLFGLPTPGPLTLYGAATGGSPIPPGGTFTWDGGSSLTYSNPSDKLVGTFSVHGASQDTLFAVGGAGNPIIHRYRPQDQTWLPEAIPATNAYIFRDVWIASNTCGFAVGGEGTVLRWDGQAWTKLPSPDPQDILLAIIAFGPNSAYATSAHGKIFRFDGTNWQTIYSGTEALHAITGTGPDDLWAVGANGRVIHWPNWP